MAVGSPVWILLAIRHRWHHKHIPPFREQVCSGGSVQTYYINRIKRNATRKLAHHGAPSEAGVVAVTNGRLDFGTWERIFSGQTEELARES